MTSTFDLRDARDDDMPAVQAIYADHVLHGISSFELEPPDLAELLQRRCTVLAKGLPYLVAERAGEILGYGYVTPYRPRRATASRWRILCMCAMGLVVRGSAMRC